MRTLSQFPAVLPVVLLSILSSRPAARAGEPMMKAMVVHAYGGPEALKLEDAPRPVPKDDEVLVRMVIDYTKRKFEDGQEVDVVLDSVGKDTLARSYGVVKKGGFIASLVARPNQAELDKHGIHGAPIAVKPNAAELAEITKEIESGKIKPVVSQVLLLSEAVKAQQDAATHHTRGKIVLKIAEEPKA